MNVQRSSKRAAQQGPSRRGLASALARWQSATDREARVFDPYMVWAELTRFAGFRQGSRGLLRVAIEFADEHQRRAFTRTYAKLDIKLSPHYRERVQRPGCRFVCVLAPRSALPKLARQARRLKAGLIGNAEFAGHDEQPRLRIGELDSPALRASIVRRLRQRLVGGGRGQVEGLGFFQRVRAVPAEAPARLLAPSKPLLAVIDFGCAFAHPHFLAEGRTRITHFWDQGRNAVAGKQTETAGLWPWRKEPNFAYGREATAARLNALMQAVRHAAIEAAGTLTAERFEEACYIAAAMPELVEPSSHGTAVLDIAAGWPHPYAESGTQPDAAAHADIVFVQLPQQAIEDLSGGWVTVYVLDALEYVLAKAGHRPVVVNISLGSHGGPHDGSSLLESAFEQLIASHPGLSIVLAAGNAADKRGHARAEIGAGRTAELTWAVPPGDPTQSFLEFWYPQVAIEHAPVFEVTHARVPRQSFSGATAQPILSPSGSALMGAFVHVPRSNAGRNAGMALLALAPTCETPAAAAAGMGLAPAGNWSISITSSSPEVIEVHSWIERDEPGAARFTDRVTSVLVAGPNSGFKVTEASTLTGQATGCGPYVVGGYALGQPVQRPQVGPVMIVDESGRGPARAGPRRGVDALAPSDRWEGGLLRGLPALANRSTVRGSQQPGLASDGSAGLSGTSLAAPWVARQIFNAVAADSTLRTKAQVVAHLRSSVAGHGSTSLPMIIWPDGAGCAAKAATPG